MPTVRVLDDESWLSEAVILTWYSPEALKVAVVLAAVASANVTAPGPLTFDQDCVTVPVVG